MIAYSLSKISAENSYNWLICVEVIVCYISVAFLTHTVYVTESLHTQSCVPVTTFKEKRTLKAYILEIITTTATYS